MSKITKDKRKRAKREKARQKGLADAAKTRKAQTRTRPSFQVAKSQNGARIQALMIRAKWDPAEYKDCVVIINDRLIDWMDSYELTDNEGKPLGPSQALLVHKSKLHGVIPDRIADLFWHRGTNTRVVKTGPAAPPPVRVPAKAAPERPRKPPKEDVNAK